MTACLMIGKTFLAAHVAKDPRFQSPKPHRPAHFNPYTLRPVSPVRVPRGATAEQVFRAEEEAAERATMQTLRHQAKNVFRVET